MLESLVPFGAVLAMILVLVMIVMHVLALCNFKIGEFLWLGDEEVLSSKKKMYSAILIPFLILLLVLILLCSKFIEVSFPFNIFLWFITIVMAYYTVTYYQAPKKARIFNMTWGFFLTLCLLLLSYCF